MPITKLANNADIPPTALDAEPRRLRFTDPIFERAFQEDYGQRRIPQFRLAFWIGVVIQIPVSFRFALVVPHIGPRDPRFWSNLALGLAPNVLGLLLARSPRTARWLRTYIVFHALFLGITLLVIQVRAPLGWTTLSTFLTAICILPRLRARETALVLYVIIGWFAFLTIVIAGRPAGFLVGPLISLGALSIFILAANFMLEYSARRDFLLQQLLSQEREKSERLLLNVLPATIAARLKESPNTVADSFAEVTVLFADIADSTPNIARLTPEVAVELLNDIFTTFDGLAAKHGLEKIKTIGDAYMVAGGLPEPRPDHAQAVVAMALEMREAIERFTWPSGERLRLRIGINTGPVVAGVIGTSKFIYDLWGDTVAVASRMESHGIIGAIQLTEATYEQVRGLHGGAERTIDVKGKGPMSVFVLEAASAVKR